MLMVVVVVEFDDGGKCVFESPHLCLNMNRLKIRIYIYDDCDMERRNDHGYYWLVFGGWYV